MPTSDPFPSGKLPSARVPADLPFYQGAMGSHSSWAGRSDIMGHERLTKKWNSSEFPLFLVYLWPNISWSHFICFVFSLRIIIPQLICFCRAFLPVCCISCLIKYSYCLFLFSIFRLPTFTHIQPVWPEVLSRTFKHHWTPAHPEPLCARLGTFDQIQTDLGQPSKKIHEFSSTTSQPSLQNDAIQKRG